MQQNQNITQNTKPAMQEVQNRPEKKFKAGAISVSVWKNSAIKDGKAVEYKTVSLGRSYKKDGVWQNNNTSLRVNDLPKLAVIINEAYKYLVTSVQEQGGEEPIVM